MSGLDTEFRPKYFEEIKGNNQIILELIRLIKNPKIPSSFLLTGPSGCGKTTIARIIASSLLKDISLNFKEYNASHFSGIDLIRSIEQSVNMTPIGNKEKYRIWFFDECHRLTSNAQDCILKLLEDPPQHCIFILATAEPSKLNKMILRRCYRLDLKSLDENELKDYVIGVLRRLNIKPLRYITKSIIDKSNGSPGFAIKQIEKINLIDRSKIEDRDYILSLLETNDEIIEIQCIDLCRTLINKKSSWMDVAKILRKLKDSNEDSEKIRRAILGYCDSCLLGNDIARAGLIKMCFQANQCNTYMDGFGAIITSAYGIFISE